jgi:glycerophosphoryl diester phosphodiesterase
MKNLLLLFLLTNIVMAQKSKHIEIQGHRGARGLLPENTIPAFRKAIDLGVETLELDVVVSKDKIVVVSHDPFFNPNTTTDPKGKPVKNESDYNLYNLNYASIRLFDVGIRGNPNFKKQEKTRCFKPTLLEVIRDANRYAKLKKRPAPKFNIEIKSLENEYNLSQPGPKDFSDLVLKTIGKRIRPENLCIQSFDFNVLRYLNEVNAPIKKFKISVLIEPLDENEITPNLDKLGFTPDIWSPYFKTLSESRILELRQKQIRVIPWTINEVKDIEQMIEMGCDGIISDYPDRVIKAIKK